MGAVNRVTMLGLNCNHIITSVINLEDLSNFDLLMILVMIVLITIIVAMLTRTIAMIVILVTITSGWELQGNRTLATLYNY